MGNILQIIHKQKLITTRQRILRLAHLLVPVLIYQLASFSAQVIDTMMTGNYNEVHLAGVGIGANLWTPFFTLFTGIISALTPIVGQLLGAKEYKKITHAVRQFLFIGVLVTIAFFVFGIVLLPVVLNQMALTEEVRYIAFQYLMFLSMGMLPSMLFTVLRSFVDGLGKTRVSMLFMLLLVPFNMILNYLLIYGKFGLPEMGGAGAGLGTALSYWLVLLIVLLIVKYQPGIADYRVLYLDKPDITFLKQAFKTGLPIGLAIFAETGIFSFVGLLMSMYTAQIIAAHQAAMNFTSFLYSFPLSISSALTIAVSQEVGANRLEEARSITKVGIIMSMTIAIFTMLLLFFNRYTIATLYGSDVVFVRLITSFLNYGLLFQIADCFAAPIQGVLRGYKDTVMPFYIGLVGHWLIGIPIAWILSRVTNLGPYSFWIGLIIGLFACGTGLLFRLRKIQKLLKING